MKASASTSTHLPISGSDCSLFNFFSREISVDFWEVRTVAAKSCSSNSLHSFFETEENSTTALFCVTKVDYVVSHCISYRQPTIAWAVIFRSSNNFSIWKRLFLVFQSNSLQKIANINITILTVVANKVLYSFFTAVNVVLLSRKSFQTLVGRSTWTITSQS